MKKIITICILLFSSATYAGPNDGEWKNISNCISKHDFTSKNLMINNNKIWIIGKEFKGKINKKNKIGMNGHWGTLIGELKNKTIFLNLTNPKYDYQKKLTKCSIQFIKIEDKKFSQSSTTTTSSSNNNINQGTQEDLIVNVGDRVFFSYSSAELDPDAMELLQDQVAWIKKHNVSVTIEGHSDERTVLSHALALGTLRAKSVENYLISMGVNSQKISIISYGKERPAVVSSNDGAWSQNRRAVTIVNY